ncbi:MAG: hypothetical protein AAB347_02515 [Bacteroidota bacterium]
MKTADAIQSKVFVDNKKAIVQLDPAAKPQGWTNFYRSDDVSATAYFYLDKPSNNLPAIQSVEIRTKNLRQRK